jgi:hypothetical protein
VNGYQARAIDAPPGTVNTPTEQAEAFVAATGASIHHGGGRAFYRPSTDSIHPPPRDFIGTPTSSAAESYYATLCHELCHWTSPEPRCNRQLGKRFGDQAYAMEELVAELEAAFLCADLCITDDPRADHAQYLASWLAVLKADKKAIFIAASKASEAATFLAALQPTNRNAGMRCAVPAVIYKDHRGNRLPSVTTIIGRFKESGGLLYWANQQGLEGKTLDQARAEVTTPGTLAVEDHINGRPETALRGAGEVTEKARNAYASYLHWEAMNRITFRHTEVSLASEVRVRRHPRPRAHIP